MIRFFLLTLAMLCCAATAALPASAGEKAKGEAKPVLDPAPGPGQKPYQPADGQIMEVTPPAPR